MPWRHTNSETNLRAIFKLVSSKIAHSYIIQEEEIYANHLDWIRLCQQVFHVHEKPWPALSSLASQTWSANSSLPQTSSKITSAIFATDYITSSRNIHFKILLSFARATGLCANHIVPKSEYRATLLKQHFSLCHVLHLQFLSACNFTLPSHLLWCCHVWNINNQNVSGPETRNQMASVTATPSVSCRTVFLPPPAFCLPSHRLYPKCNDKTPDRKKQAWICPSLYCGEAAAASPLMVYLTFMRLALNLSSSSGIRANLSTPGEDT